MKSSLPRCLERCLTFGQYIEQSARYFTKGSVFLFLAGNHSLETSVHFENISDILFIGESNNIDVNFITGSGVINVWFENATTIEIANVRFVLNSTSGFVFSNSKEVEIAGSTFQGNGDVDARSTAIYSRRSSLDISSCLFRGNAGLYGGAVSSTESNISLHGNVFEGKHLLVAVPWEYQTVTSNSRR